MKTLTSLSPFLISSKPKLGNFPKTPNVSIKPPPPEFDFRSELSKDSQTAISKSHPELLDLVESDSLVLIEKRLFGPTPIWRKFIFRAGIMYTSNEGDSGPQLKSNMFSLSGAGFFGAVGRSINLGGQTALALRLLLAVFSSKISSDANRPFGDEFRAARKAAEDIGAQLVLGDRPIEITLERAWKSLNWNEKLGLVVSVFRGITAQSSDISTSKFKDLEKDESPFRLYEKLSITYPSLLQPLIHERDTVVFT
ncbi:hypothetical protein IFM89_035080 [Coptis chinensis]|uniref:Uncharacterized protein n=1 Tax=Coptis chinensis TaxID=261450 RepID=A0A835M2G4_9MAGN|nr:hypothetical protein IFM89_035080 [Coptis chinensis]